MKCFILLLVLGGSILLVSPLGDFMLGPGQWLVLNVMQCKNSEQYEVGFEVVRKKINRTHDCFTGSGTVVRELNNSYSIFVNVYKKMDGGFKFYQTIEDDCFCTFLMRNARENIERVFTMAEIDPPRCPIQPGHYIVKEGFVMDYTELPKHGIYGTYEVDAFLLLEKKKMACVKVQLLFEREDDDDLL